MKEDKVSPLPRFDELRQAAEAARAKAYAPYSGYTVGAALLGSDGQIYAGCNVENASYGAAICAERNAIGAMVAAGCLEIEAVVVVTRDLGSPCGICRQTLFEFSANRAAEIPVVCLDEQGRQQAFRLGDLLPHAFQLDREQ